MATSCPLCDVSLSPKLKLNENVNICFDIIMEQKSVIMEQKVLNLERNILILEQE